MSRAVECPAADENNTLMENLILLRPPCPDAILVPAAGWAGRIMKGWRMRVQCHVPSPLIPRPGPFTTTWSRPVHKGTWCYRVQSKPPSAHFLSSLAFLSLVNRITMKLSPSSSLSIKDADVCRDVNVWWLPVLQPPDLWGYKLNSKGGIQCWGREIYLRQAFIIQIKILWCQRIYCTCFL